MHVLSAAEMQACDRATTERYGVPSVLLMRAASSAVAEFVRSQYPQVRRVTVLCGKGNNGGDGMMAARLLADAGLSVTTLFLGEPAQLNGDAAQAWQELTSEKIGVVRVISTAADLARLSAVLETDLILDAVLGTGFVPPMRGLALDALHWLRSAAALPPVVAVDLPSGWAADRVEASAPEDVYPADAVVSFTAPKLAHVFGQLTRSWHQPVVIAPIGSPDDAVVSSLHVEWAGSALTMAQTPRAQAANKGNFGHVLVIGGAFGSAGGKAGAPAMTAMAAMRAGAGLVTAAVPEPALSIVAAFAPELMTWPLVATAKGEISAKNLTPAHIAAVTAGKTVLAIGPGMGQSAETARFVLGILSSSDLPAVVDADALNILATKPAQLPKLTNKGERLLVLTPHPGEMARLTKKTVADVQANRLEVAREFAQRWGAVVVLKGARTLIAHPDGRVAVNTSGNPGMAKGGSGDLLTGLIAGMIAQYPHETAQAIEAAVYLHGLAADLAVRDADEHTLLATDVVGTLAQAFQSMHHRFDKGAGNRYVWLQGIPTAQSQGNPARSLTGS